jgi:C1A family cysteine protease
MQAQQSILRYGGVVTRFDIYSDFRKFFNNPKNKKAIYQPEPGAVVKEAHAVVLVGYNNDKGYWVVKNSWGDKWADGGFFKVSCLGRSLQAIKPSSER